MHGLKMLVLAAAISTTAATAEAQAGWPVIYRGPNVAVSLDTAGANRNPDGSYLTRTRWDYKSDRLLESKRPYRQMTEVALIRCTPVRIKRLSETFYSETGAVVREGSMPQAADVQYMNWDRLRVGTDGSRAFTAVCNRLTRAARRG